MPLSLRCHWNDVVGVGSPDTFPAVAVSIFPTFNVPLMVGSVVILGANELGGIAANVPVLPTTIL